MIYVDQLPKDTPEYYSLTGTESEVPPNMSPSRVPTFQTEPVRQIAKTVLDAAGATTPTIDVGEGLEEIEERSTTGTEGATPSNLPASC